MGIMDIKDITNINVVTNSSLSGTVPSTEGSDPELSGSQISNRLFESTMLNLK